MASERNGTWHAAEEVPGTAALNTPMDARVNSVSCGPGGYCAAGGYYEFDNGGPWYPSPFVATAKNGQWGTAKNPPGSAILNNGFNAPIGAVSCPSAGNCTAVGFIWEVPPNVIQGNWQAWVVTQKNGVWGVAEPIRGLGSNSVFSPLSCSLPGNCGTASAASVATERNGRWGKAEEVPGLAALNKGRNAAVSSVSCPSARNCIAVGYYTDGNRHAQAFVGGAK